MGAHTITRLSGLDAALSGSSAGCVSSLNSASRCPLKDQRFDGTGRDLFCVAKVLTAAAAAAVSSLDVEHLMGVERSIFGSIRIKIIADNDRSVNGECPGTQGLERFGCNLTTVDFATVWHHHTAKLRPV
jgi:hypothetical protein